MKVAFVGTGDARLDRYPPGGGIEHQVWLLADGLAAKGHEVAILSRDGPDRGANPRIVHVPCEGDGHVLPKLGMGRRAARWLRENPPDVVYLSEKWVSLAASRLPFPKIYATHNKDAFASYRRLAYRDHPVNLLFFDVKKSLEEREMRRAEVVAANSEGIAAYLAQRGIPRVDLLPPAVDVDAFRAEREEGQPYLFASAQLLPVKGTRFLVEAFALVCGNHDGWRLVIGGEGPERPRIEALVRERGISDRVAFVGWSERDAYIERLSRCSAFVLPSLAETFGTVLLEAMASGKPVVSTDIPGPRDAVAHERTGLVVPPADVPALAAALDRLMGDAPLRRRLGEAGLARVRERYSRDAAVSGFERLARIAIERRQGAAAK